MERRIQNPEVRIQNDNYSDSCLLTPELFIFKALQRFVWIKIPPP
jgi:hypothetical protein